MAKKHTSGFAPISYKFGGKILLPISAALVIIGALDNLAGWGIVPQAVLFVGLGLFLISLYLLYVVPKE